MATIYRITQMPTQPRQSEAQGDARSAEIILFPGVRYERWEDDTPPAPSKGANRARPVRTG